MSRQRIPFQEHYHGHAYTLLETTVQVYQPCMELANWCRGGTHTRLSKTGRKRRAGLDKDG